MSKLSLKDFIKLTNLSEAAAGYSSFVTSEGWLLSDGTYETVRNAGGHEDFAMLLIISYVLEQDPNALEIIKPYLGAENTILGKPVTLENIKGALLTDNTPMHIKEAFLSSVLNPNEVLRAINGDKGFGGMLEMKYNAFRVVSSPKSISFDVWKLTPSELDRITNFLFSIGNVSNMSGDCRVSIYEESTDFFGGLSVPAFISGVHTKNPGSFKSVARLNPD